MSGTVKEMVVGDDKERLHISAVGDAEVDGTS